LIQETDQQLITRVVRRDDRQAFGLLVNRYQSRVRQSLRQWCHNDACAEDLAQETFIKAYLGLKSFRQDAQLSSWLYRIAYRCFADFHRKEKRYTPLEEETDLTEPSHSPITQLHQQRDLNWALQQLSDAQQLVLDLHLTQGFSQSEVTEITGLPLGTIKTHINRGRDKLRQLLHEAPQHA